MDILLRLLLSIQLSAYCSECATNRIFGKFGSVRVFFEPPVNAPDSPDSAWGKSWPEGIRLVNNFQVQPSKATPPTQKRIPPVRRTYNWQGEELLISLSMPHLADPLCTRLVPPITWLAASGAKVKVLHSNVPSAPSNSSAILSNNEYSDSVSSDAARMPQQGSKSNKVSSSMIELAVARNIAESSLSTLRMHGFKREDIYRMLDKGPWVLAFNIPTCLPRLFKSLQTDLRLNQTQAVHIISHCPYLIAQYARYKGRDVYATVSALMEAGCTWKNLAPDLLRFPSMLAAPPDRIKGWWSLLSGFGVATTPALFGKMLRKAPFMFYINPPNLFDNEDRDYISDDDVSATASGFVVYESLRVLQLLQALDIPDLDKVVRTQPSILLVHSTEINARISFLFNLCLDNSASSGYLPKSSNTAGAVGASAGAAAAAAAAGAVAATAILGGASTSTLGKTNSKLSDIIASNVAAEFGSVDISTTITSRQTVLGSGDNDNVPRSYAISRPVWRRQRNAADHLTTTASRIADATSTASPTEEFSVSFNENQEDDSATTVTKAPLNNDVRKKSGAEESQLRSHSSQASALANSEADSADLPRPDPASVAMMEASQKKAKQLLGSLVLTYPAILSVDYQQMRAAGNALRSSGLRRNEVVLLARRYPLLLSRSSAKLTALMSFLKFNIGLRKNELAPFLNKYPALMGVEPEDLEPKVDYLFQSIGGSQDMLRRFPMYLSFDLELHIRPRAEFLRAMGVEPLKNGISFLVTAPEKEIAHLTGVKEELFHKFMVAFTNMYKEKALKKMYDDSSSNYRLNKIKESKDLSKRSDQIQDSGDRIATPEEILLDELDFDF